LVALPGHATGCPLSQLAAAQTHGTPARIWFGNMRSGLPVGVFVGCVRPENRAMDELLSSMLDQLNIVEVTRDDGVPDRIRLLVPEEPLR